MIDYEFVDRYYMTIEHDREIVLLSYIYNSIEESIKKMFKPDSYNGYDFIIDNALECLEIEVDKNGEINVYFYDVRCLDQLKSKCECFEKNIKMTLNRLGETIRFIYDTEVE